MKKSTKSNLLTQAIIALQGGNKSDGARLLVQVLAQNPGSEIARFWYETALSEDIKKRFPLQEKQCTKPDNTHSGVDQCPTGVSLTFQDNPEGKSQVEHQSKEAIEDSAPGAISRTADRESKYRVSRWMTSQRKRQFSIRQAIAKAGHTRESDLARLSRSQLFIINLLILGIIGALISLGFVFLNDAYAMPLISPILPPWTQPNNSNITDTNLQPSPSSTWIETNPVPTAINTYIPSTEIPTAIPPMATSTPLSTQSTLIATPTSTPVIGKPMVIGYSVAGRELVVYRFGTGPIIRMIVAGIHGGNEWNTIALANELIAHLRQHPELIPEQISLYILPSLNPDGEARGHNVDGRVNDNGVDLNRNWDAFWQADWPRAGCWIWRPVTGGAYPGSEPETHTLMNFLLSHEVSALISYHSAAMGVYAGGLPPDPTSVRLAEALSAVSTYQYPPIDTGCQFTGTLSDWCVLQGFPAVDIELTNFRDTDFEINLKVLSAFLAWQP